jgi:uncharacterized protein YgiM (DUF1202 family)
MRKYLAFCALVLSVLACDIGIKDPLPFSPVSKPISQVSELRPTTQPEQSKMVVCNSGGLNLREGAGTNFVVLMVIQDGEVVVRTRKLEKTPVFTDWYEVVYKSKTGWVSSRYLCLVKK